jgi:hypothetical protein
LSIDRVKSMVKRLISLLLLPLVLGACGVNPVTGERELVLVSESSEIRMGEQNYAPMQQAQGGEYDIDPVLTEYVQGIGDRLAAVSDRKLPYEFVVLNNTVPNAWALPGGKIAINRGLLTELGSEAELAAVLGHEIVHAAARHSAQQMERGMLLQGLILATAVASSDSDYGNLAVGGASVAGQLINQRYGRGGAAGGHRARQLAAEHARCHVAVAPDADSQRQHLPLMLAQRESGHESRVEGGWRHRSQMRERAEIVFCRDDLGVLGRRRRGWTRGGRRRGTAQLRRLRVRGQRELTALIRGGRPGAEREHDRDQD